METSRTEREASLRTGQTVLARGEGAEPLKRLAEIANDLGTERIAVEVADLAQRVAEGRFYVACVGQFKRGKSTLLDALVGEPVLPTGIVPVTAVPTVVRFGERRAARVRLRNNEWTWINPEELQDYVSEERNSENAKGVDGVEVFVPSPLLASGMCLVDTPGLGSVFAGNTAATQRFVPHIDAAIVVIGADPPMAGDELVLMEAVSQHVPDILVVLNKADRVTETDLTIAAAFAAKMLQSRLQRSADTIYAISAAERLQRRGPERDWGRFIAALEKLATESGRSLIRSAGERGVQRYGEQLLVIVGEERTAMLRPLEESERRIAAMRQTITDAERSLHELGYLFTAEQHRLSDLFLGRRREFLNATLPVARAELKGAVARLPHQSGPAYRRAVMREAQEIARKQVTPWLQAEEAYAEQVYRKVAKRFVDLANDFLRRLAEAGVLQLAQMPHALDGERGFGTRSRFRFYDLITVAQPASVFRFLADSMLGAVGAFARLEHQTELFLERLLEVNSARIQNDVNDRVLESRHRLEADIRVLLLDVSHVAEQALEHARTAQASGTAAVQSAVARLAGLEQELAVALSASWREKC